MLMHLNLLTLARGDGTGVELYDKTAEKPCICSLPFPSLPLSSLLSRYEHMFVSYCEERGATVDQIIRQQKACLSYPFLFHVTDSLSA
jgi:hypothetical protein